MATININVKPTAGGAKINLDVGPNATVLELKEMLADQASMPAAEQRLIYKGQILKDEKTLDSYGARPADRRAGKRRAAGRRLTPLPLRAGIANEHTLHLVRSRPQGAAAA